MAKDKNNDKINKLSEEQLINELEESVNKKEQQVNDKNVENKEKEEKGALDKEYREEGEEDEVDEDKAIEEEGDKEEEDEEEDKEEDDEEDKAIEKEGDDEDEEKDDEEDKAIEEEEGDDEDKAIEEEGEKEEENEEEDKEEYDEEDKAIEKEVDDEDEGEDEEEEQEGPVNGENNYVLEGGYKHDLQIPIEIISDNPLIDSERIKNKVELYLNNYYSKEYTKYPNKLEIFYKKIKKNEYLKHDKNFIYLIKNNKDKKEIILDKIKKPQYIHISKRKIELEYAIKSHHSKVVSMFNYLKGIVISNPEEIKKFKKEKNKYIALLEEKEIINLYFATINKIDINEEKTNVIYQNKDLKYLNSKDIILESKIYKIPDETVVNINTIQSERLNQYNDLMINLKKGKIDKDTKEKIIEYLSNKDLKNIISKTNNEKKNQDNYIDYIVIETP